MDTSSAEGNCKAGKRTFKKAKAKTFGALRPPASAFAGLHPPQRPPHASRASAAPRSSFLKSQLAIVRAMLRSVLEGGSRIGPYEVLAKLGAGGMGEVYRARDTRLGREVALKVLGEARFDDEPSIRRFQQEARLAAALDHPNILAVHDVGEHERQPYLVSELLEGD